MGRSCSLICSNTRRPAQVALTSELQEFHSKATFPLTRPRRCFNPFFNTTVKRFLRILFENFQKLAQQDVELCRADQNEVFQLALYWTDSEPVYAGL